METTTVKLPTLPESSLDTQLAHVRARLRIEEAGRRNAPPFSPEIAVLEDAMAKTRAEIVRLTVAISRRDALAPENVRLYLDLPRAEAEYRAARLAQRKTLDRLSKEPQPDEKLRAIELDCSRKGVPFSRAAAARARVYEAAIEPELRSRRDRAEIAERELVEPLRETRGRLNGLRARYGEVKKVAPKDHVNYVSDQVALAEKDLKVLEGKAAEAKRAADAARAECDAAVKSFLVEVDKVAKALPPVAKKEAPK